jgi:predicted nucleic acid-binding protein
MYRQFLTGGQHLHFHSIEESDALMASEIRAEFNLTLLDAFQVAAARQSGCHAILTNDRALRRVAQIRAIVLDDLLD